MTPREIFATINVMWYLKFNSSSMCIPKYLTVEVMQISDLSAFILPNFPLSLNLELISITFDLNEFNVNLFASIQRWRFLSLVFASS